MDPNTTPLPQLKNTNEALYAQALAAKLNLGLVDSPLKPSALEYLRNYGPNVDDLSLTTTQTDTLLPFESPRGSPCPKIQSLIDVNIKSIEDEDTFLYGESVILTESPAESNEIITNTDNKITSNLEKSSWSDDDDDDYSENVLDTKDKPTELINCNSKPCIKLKPSPSEDVQKPSAQIAPIMKCSIKPILKLPSVPTKIFEMPLPDSPKFIPRCTTKKNRFQSKNITTSSDSNRQKIKFEFGKKIVQSIQPFNLIKNGKEIKEEKKTPPHQIQFNDCTTLKTACTEESNQLKNLNKKPLSVEDDAKHFVCSEESSQVENSNENPLEEEDNDKHYAQIKFPQKHSEYCKRKKKYRHSNTEYRRHHSGKRSHNIRSDSSNSRLSPSPLRRSREPSPRRDRERARRSRGSPRRYKESPRRYRRSPRPRRYNDSPKRRYSDSPNPRYRERSPRRRSIVHSPDYLRSASGRNVFSRSKDRKYSPSPKIPSPRRRSNKSKERSSVSPKRQSNSRHRYRSKSSKKNAQSSTSDSGSSSDTSSQSRSSRSTSS